MTGPVVNVPNQGDQPIAVEVVAGRKIQRVVLGITPPDFDYVSASAVGPVTTYTYRLGGSAGTVVGTVVVTVDGSGNFVSAERA